MQVKADIPAIVLGHGLTALGVLRCLGRRNIVSYCVSDDPGMLVHSRWYRKCPCRDESLARADGLARFLSNACFDSGVLMPCGDNWVIEASRLDGSLLSKYAVCQPRTETLELLVDKGRFSELLQRLDVPHPVTALIDSEAQLMELEDHRFVGSFLKPRESLEFFNRYGVKACRVSSKPDAVAQYRNKSADGFKVVFQEYIPGPASNHFFIDGFMDRNGVVCGLFARQRLRMYPTDFGNSSYMVSVSLDSVKPAEESIRKLLAAISYRGIFSAEFKRDDRDGRFKLLEINARPWWFVEFASTCGVDVCWMAYLDALGEKVRPVNAYQVGVRAVHPYFDINACFEMVRSGKMTLWAWARSWMGARYPVLCSDDPLPAIQWWTRKLFRKAANSMTRK